MQKCTRRTALKVLSTAGLVATGAPLLRRADAAAYQAKYPIEKGAELRVLRWKRLDNGYAGRLGTASAAVMADYVMVNMVAAAASGESSPQTAAQRAERRAKHYYS